METITTEFVNVVGFPVAVCFALVWVIRDMSKNKSELLKEFRQAIDNNTAAIHSMIQQINRGNDK